MKISIRLVPAAMLLLLSGCSDSESEHFKEVAGSLPSVMAAAEQAGVVTSVEKVQSIIDKAATLEEWKVTEAAIDQYSNLASKIGLDRDALDKISRNQPEDKAFIADKFKLISSGLDAVKRSVQGREVRIYVNWKAASPSSLTVFPYLSRIKGVVKMLSFRAMWHAQNGRIDEAVSDLEAAGRIGRTISSDPIIVSYLVFAASDSIVSRAWENCLTALKGNEAFLKKTKGFMGKDYGLPGYEMVAGEGLFKLETFESAGKPEFKGLLTDEAGKETKLPNVSPEILRSAFTARTFESGIEIKKAFDKSNFKDSDAILKSFSEKLSSSEDTTLYFEKENFDLFRSANNIRFNAANRSKIRMAMIDVLSFKNKNGRFPKSLAEAGVKNLDLITNEPFKYKTTANGVVIYSIGDDLTDNGGRTTVEAGQRDYAVVYPFVPIQRDN